MLVLSYIGILALIPLLTEKNAREVQWHAKHGIVLLVAEIVVWVVYFILAQIPGVGCVLAILIPIIWLIFLAIRIVCIVKGTNGQRLLIPGISEFADKM